MKTSTIFDAYNKTIEHIDTLNWKLNQLYDDFSKNIDKINAREKVLAKRERQRELFKVHVAEYLRAAEEHGG